MTSFNIIDSQENTVPSFQSENWALHLKVFGLGPSIFIELSGSTQPGRLLSLSGRLLSLETNFKIGNQINSIWYSFNLYIDTWTRSWNIHWVTSGFDWLSAHMDVQGHSGKVHTMWSTVLRTAVCDGPVRGSDFRSGSGNHDMNSYILFYWPIFFIHYY